MDIFGTIRKVFVTTENDVLAFATKVWHEVPVVEAEIGSAFKWITGKGLPALQTDIAAIMPFVAILGDLTGHPELRAEMALLNTAMAGVNAFANAANAGTMTADDVVKGYGSLKQASAAAQKVVSTAAVIVAVTPSSNAK